jgi:hypothetical protein
VSTSVWVGDVVALPLEEPDELDLPFERLQVAGLVGTLKGDRIGAAERTVRVVEAPAAEWVVRLPRVDGHLDEDLGAAVGRRPDDLDRGRAVPGLGAAEQSDADEVVAAHRVVRECELIGHRPVGAGLPGLVRLWASSVLGARDQASAAAAVPPEPVDLDVVRRRGSGSHVEVQNLARQGADLRGVPLDRRPGRFAAVPGACSRQAVLDRDGVVRGADDESSRRGRQSRRDERHCVC